MSYKNLKLIGAALVLTTLSSPALAVPTQDLTVGNGKKFCVGNYFPGQGFSHGWVIWWPCWLG
jgi:hypothetical protein